MSRRWFVSMGMIRSTAMYVVIARICPAPRRKLLGIRLLGGFLRNAMFKRGLRQTRFASNRQGMCVMLILGSLIMSYISLIICVCL